MDTRTMVDIFKHVVIIDWDRERLNMSGNTPACKSACSEVTAMDTAWVSCFVNIHSLEGLTHVGHRYRELKFL